MDLVKLAKELSKVFDVDIRSFQKFLRILISCTSIRSKKDRDFLKAIRGNMKALKELRCIEEEMLQKLETEISLLKKGD